MASHRRSMSGLKVEETEKWGSRTAYERFGKPQYLHGAPRPEDRSGPQKLGDSNNLQGNRYDNDVRNDWRRGAGESAEGKPGFDRGRK
jgi:K+-transporting ATPase c subunit